MAFSPRQQRRANRSNAYSKSKYTNWRKFDPYQGEITAIPRDLEPTFVYQITEEETCSIFERPVHESFIRPYDSNDVARVLDKLPRRFLIGLKSIYLLGGTWKQDKTAFSHSALLVSYGRSTIHVYATPRRKLKSYYDQLPKPDILQEITRAGAKLEQKKDGWSCEYDEISLKRLFLFDVLIHEIGHHVDRKDLDSKNVKDAEAFAEWFVREQGFLSL